MLLSFSLPNLNTVGGSQIEFVAGLDTKEVVPVVYHARDAVHAVEAGRVYIGFYLLKQFLVCTI